MQKNGSIEKDIPSSFQNVVFFQNFVKTRGK